MAKLCPFCTLHPCARDHVCKRHRKEHKREIQRKKKEREQREVLRIEAAFLEQFGDLLGRSEAALERADRILEEYGVADEHELS